MIKINNTSYDAYAIVAQDGSMELTFTDGSVDSLVSKLIKGTRIEVFEDDKIVGVYYNRQLDKIEYSNGKITAVLRGSTIAEDDKTNLELAIVELAEIVMSLSGEVSE